MRPTFRPRPSRPGRPHSPSAARRSSGESSQPGRAAIFAALGDGTRLLLVARLSGGHPISISELTAGSNLTRQAITKHLHVLEDAGIVHSLRSGRESLFQLDPRPIEEVQNYLAQIAAQWDDALGRLKSFVER